MFYLTKARNCVRTRARSASVSMQFLVRQCLYRYTEKMFSIFFIKYPFENKKRIKCIDFNFAWYKFCTHKTDKLTLTSCRRDIA